MLRRFLAALALLAAMPAFAGTDQLSDLSMPGAPLIGSGPGAVPMPVYLASAPTGASAGTGTPSAVTATTPDVTGSGTVQAGTANSAYAVSVNNQGTARFRISGLSGTGAVLTAEYTADGGTTWESIAILRPPLAYGTTVSADGQYEVKASATTGLRLRVSTAGTAGTVSIASVLTNAQGLVGIVGSLPPGSNLVGKVGIDQTTPGTTNGVVVNASALPAGAALEAGNLATIVARTPVLGQATKAASQPVVVASDQGPLTAAPVTCTMTQNVVALPANASTQLAGANPNRRGIEVQNIGANPFTVAMGTSATAGAGLILAAGTNNAGGSEKFFTGAVPTNAVSAIATAATTALVWECQ